MQPLTGYEFPEGQRISQAELSYLLGTKVEWQEGKRLICSFGVNIPQSLAQSVEVRVFGQRFGDTPDLRRDVWSLFEDKSFSVVCLNPEMDEQGRQCYRAVGAVRIVCGSEISDFKSLAFMTQPEHWGRQSLEALQNRLEGLPMSQVWDIATLAMSPGQNRWSVMAMIYAVNTMMREAGVRFLLGICAQEVYNDMNTMGMGFISLGHSKDYYGVVSQPFVMDITRIPETMSQKYYGILFERDRLDDFDFLIKADRQSSLPIEVL